MNLYYRITYSRLELTVTFLTCCYLASNELQFVICIVVVIVYIFFAFLNYQQLVGSRRDERTVCRCRQESTLVPSQPLEKCYKFIFSHNFLILSPHTLVLLKWDWMG